MKFYLICLVFILFICFAVVVYLHYKTRYKLFKDLGYICKVLKNNISFNKNDIKTIVSDAYNQISLTSKLVIENLKKSSFKILKKDDIFLLNAFFDSLGKGDVDYEIHNIEYYENVFNEYEKQAKEELTKKGSTYFKILIAIGIIVCVLLI